MMFCERHKATAYICMLGPQLKNCLEGLGCAALLEKVSPWEYANFEIARPDISLCLLPEDQEAKLSYFSMSTYVLPFIPP